MKTLTLFLCLFFSVNALAQNIVLDNNFNMELNKITYKKTITATLQVVGAKSKHKFISLDVVFYSTSNKKIQFPLSEMKFRANSKDYKVILQQGLGAYSSVSGQYLKFKKKKKTTLYIEVQDNFTEGTFIFKGKPIGKINVTKNSKEGIFKLIN